MNIDTNIQKEGCKEADRTYVVKSQVTEKKGSHQRENEEDEIKNLDGQI